jgi:hypothetical protein
MRNYFCFAVLLFCLPFNGVFAQKWQSASVEFASGRKIDAEIKFRDKVYTGELPIKIAKKKLSYPLDSIRSVQINGEHFDTFKLPEIEGKPVVLARKIQDNLYYAIIKEIQCLCDNSFKMIQAYLVVDSDIQILRKKALKNEFTRDTDFSRFSYISDPFSDFSAFPDKIRPSKISE